MFAARSVPLRLSQYHARAGIMRSFEVRALSPRQTRLVAVVWELLVDDLVAIDVPPVRYARTSDDAYVAYRLYGTGAVELLVVKEWAASVDAVWEHPVHLRTQQYQAT